MQFWGFNENNFKKKFLFSHSDKITVRSDMSVFLFLILRYTE